MSSRTSWSRLLILVLFAALERHYGVPHDLPTGCREIGIFFLTLTALDFAYLGQKMFDRKETSS